MIKVVLLSFFIILGSCQTAPKSPQHRSVAGASYLSLLIKEIARETKTSRVAIEKKLMQEYLKRNVGATKPHSAKLASWAGENLAQIYPRLKPKSLVRIYDNSHVKLFGGKNIYLNPRDLSHKMLKRSQGFFQTRNIRNQIPKLKSIDEQTTLSKTLDTIESRGKNNKLLLNNGHHIVRSAYTIFMKTGVKSMGEGCENFLKYAPEKVFAMKANVDIARAQIIAQMAKAKNANKGFNHYSDIPAAKRLDQTDIDFATKEAFKKVLGHNDQEAAKALKILQRKPCKLY